MTIRMEELSEMTVKAVKLHDRLLTELEDP